MTSCILSKMREHVFALMYISHVILMTSAKYQHGGYPHYQPTRRTSAGSYTNPNPKVLQDHEYILHKYHYPEGHIGHQGVTSDPGSNTAQGQGYNCYTAPAYTYFNLTDKSYYYPLNEINKELTDRRDVLEQLFKDGVTALGPSTEKQSLFTPTVQDKQSSVGDGVKKGGEDEGCAGYTLLLQSFQAYGGHCWVLQPRHQDVKFVSCGAPKCKGYGSAGEFSACAVVEQTSGVWAWCETLPPGRRISRVYLPLPTKCKCQVFQCIA